MAKEFNQESLLGSRKQENQPSGSSIPSNYRPIKIACSGGKLEVPAVLHFRNYNMEESIILSEMSDEDELSVMAYVLTQMNYEKFDCTRLHLEELKEICLRIYATWWGKTLEGFSYVVDLEKPDTKENRSIASIPVKNVDFNYLQDGVKEPFSITIDGETHSFRLPKVGTVIQLKDIMKAQFGEEEISFRQIAKKIENREDVDPVESKAYFDFIRKKNIYESKLYNALLLQVEPEFDNFEYRMETVRTMDSRFWDELNKYVEQYFFFGVKKDIEFPCTVTGETISRRVSFRFNDFIPSLGERRDINSSIRFG